MRTLLMTLAVGLMLHAGAAARAEEVPVEYRESIRKGLEWLAKAQARDGHWDAPGGQYPVAMTALSANALLMEGSTIREGKYRDNIRRAVDWLMARSSPNGLIGNTRNPAEANSYMYGHGFAMLFLSGVVGEEEESDRRRKLVDVLERAAKFSREAQSSRGGWIYNSAKEMGDSDEGSVTVTQVQALRAARNAGIAVPQEAIKDAVKYLHDCTDSGGGVLYRIGQGGTGSPALTSAAIACGFSAGDYNSAIVKRWIKFCQGHMRGLGDGRFGHDEYTHYYFAQAVYFLGEDGYSRLFPEAKGSDVIRWSAYRKSTFANLIRAQSSDGSWSGNGGMGPVYTTALHLGILQLDNATLPIYQR